jgi:hypothetical protein
VSARASMATKQDNGTVVLRAPRHSGNGLARHRENHVRAALHALDSKASRKPCSGRTPCFGLQDIEKTTLGPHSMLWTSRHRENHVRAALHALDFKTSSKPCSGRTPCFFNKHCTNWWFL